MATLKPISINVLTRTPVAGTVKTRLFPLLGPEGAAKAHEKLLTHVVRTVQSWCEASAGDRRFLLWCTPDPLHPFFDGLVPRRARRVQPSGDLGQRLAGIVFDQIENHRSVIVVGGDAVSVSANTLDQAVSALDQCDAVMVPAEDGGYVLLALSRFHPDLFCEISWGSSTVARETEKKLTTLGWNWRKLPALWDVDRPSDWQRFEQTCLG